MSDDHFIEDILGREDLEARRLASLNRAAKVTHKLEGWLRPLRLRAASGLRFERWPQGQTPTGFNLNPNHMQKTHHE